MKAFFILIFLILLYVPAYSQGPPVITTEMVADSLQDSQVNFAKRKKVFWSAGITGYTAMATGLYFAWYKQYDQSSFHLFDDWGEWQNVDKAGHVYSAYLQSELIYDLSRWAGYEEGKALLISSVASLVGQMNIELMDGFSTKWGFSVSDLGANILGTSLFYFQQKHWHEQRLKLKMSYWPISYSKEALASETGLEESSLYNRSVGLYGANGVERFLKDYNGQSIWISANLSSFLPNSKLPKWLALAVGYSAKNLYGGFGNQWEINDENFLADAQGYPRTSQFVLAIDYDLSKIKHSTEFGKALFKILNIFKFPAPGIEYNKQDGLRFRLVFLN